MRDAAGEPADSFHLVSSLNLFFEPPSCFFGSIAFGNLVAKNLVRARQSCSTRLDAQLEFLIGSTQFFFEAFSIGDVSNVQEQSRLPEILNTAGSNPDGN